jgi:hypothetical protein
MKLIANWTFQKEIAMAIERKTLPKPTCWDEMFPGRFLKAGLFVPMFGTDKPTLTIKDYDLEALPDDDGNDKPAGILTFVETPMQFKLNKTNGDCLKAMFGKVLKAWVGKRITWCIERDRDPGGAKGAMCDAVRVLGSPDIDSDMSVTIKLPKRKPKERTLRKTGEAKKAPQVTDKPAGNVDEHVAAIAKLNDEGRAKYPAEVLSKFTWTDADRAKLTAALKDPG